MQQIRHSVQLRGPCPPDYFAVRRRDLTGILDAEQYLTTDPGQLA
ncbi:MULTISPECIES: hypothetical protein [unclassified Streptomyces]|nr:MULTISPECIES: hypothetical protein [unclassified Streptomyces]